MANRDELAERADSFTTSVHNAMCAVNEAASKVMAIDGETSDLFKMLNAANTCLELARDKGLKVRDHWRNYNE